MPIQLHRDTTEGARLTRVPKWLRPSSHNLSSYWHIPRSGSWSVHARRGEITVALWCGQMRHCNLHDLTDTEPEDMRCGTCIGRFAGYNKQDGSIFTPEDHFKIPKKCPGGDRGDGMCFSCGRRLSFRYDRYSGGSSESRHVPEPILTERHKPCPKHGWREMSPTYHDHQYNTTVYLGCTKFNCEWISR